MREIPELVAWGALLSGLLTIAIWLWDKRRNGRNDTDHQDPRGGW